MKWINVKDKLPEFGIKVLTIDKDGDISFGEYINYSNIEEPNRWYEESGSSDNEITHWMPLPEPPAENSESIYQSTDHQQTKARYALEIENCLNRINNLPKFIPSIHKHLIEILWKNKYEN